VFKKIPFLKLGEKLFPFGKKNNAQPSGLPVKQTTDFSQQNDLDKKLVFSLNKSKRPTLKQLKYLPTVLNQKQLLTFRVAAGLMAVGLIALIGNFYFRNFIPVAVSGGEYSEGLIGAPQYINPLLSQTNDVDADVVRLVFSGLLKYDENLKLVADLAKDWQVSEDKKTYTFTLKDNLKWQDGESLTADDVVFTYESIKDSEFKSPLLISFRGVEVQKVDEKTIKFVLPEPYTSFLELTTTGIIPLHIWGDIPAVNANLTEYNLKPIGSGPWEFKSLTKDKLGNIKTYTLVPNPDYAGSQGYLQKLTFKFYPDFMSAIEALKNHSVDGISFLPKNNKKDLQGNRSLNLIAFDLPQYTAVFFNQKQNEALKNKNVRQALALSIDKTKILAEALQLEGQIIDGPIFPYPINLPDDKKIAFNQDEANKLLDEAGWKRLTKEEYQTLINAKKENDSAEASTTDATSTPEQTEPKEVDENQNFYRQKDDKILEISIVTVDQSENTKAAELVRDAWQAIGVKTNLQIVSGGNIVREVIKPRGYEVLLFGIIVGSNADPTPFWHSSQVQDPGLNLSQFSNRETDKLLEDAKKTEDLEKQKKDYEQFQEILASELPAIFLYSPTYTYAINKKIKGVNTERILTPADRFNNIQNWYTKTKRIWHGGN